MQDADMLIEYIHKPEEFYTVEEHAAATREREERQQEREQARTSKAHTRSGEKAEQQQQQQQQVVVRTAGYVNRRDPTQKRAVQEVVRRPTADTRAAGS